MTNPFQDQADFMHAAAQTVGVHNPDQADLYIRLMVEEFQEITAADSLENCLKEMCDLLVVTIGAIHSIGADPAAVWQAVHASNMSKLVDGKLVKREDGKVLKPDTYAPADLVPIVLAIPGLDLVGGADAQ